MPMLVPLLAAACAHQQPSYNIVDPATGPPVPVVQRYNQPHYGQPSYGQQAYAASPAYAQPQTQDSNRGQFTANRGLFTANRGQFTANRGQFTANRGLFGAQPSAPTSAPQTYASQTYAPQPYAQQTYPQGGQGGYVQQQPHGPRGSVLQYRPPQNARGDAYAAAPYGYAYAPANQAYTLDSGDKLRVVVFGQQGITGSYTVDASGHVSLPLIGAVPARGFTTQQLSTMITERLKQGYVRQPHVTVEVATYRPFFILGEVTNPGQYPYVANMTAEIAIAIAGGFAPRADKRQVELTRNSVSQRFKGEVPLNYPLRPGDTLVVKERWF